MHDDDLFDRPLTPAPDDAEAHLFERGELGDLRAAVSRFAFRAGLAPDRVDDLVVAVNEITTNSVRHAGGGGRLRLWTEGDRVVCEITDAGRITSPMIGRLPPAMTTVNGRGLWMANQLCDLVQIRSSAAGSTIRVQLSR